MELDLAPLLHDVALATGQCRQCGMTAMQCVAAADPLTCQGARPVSTHLERWRRRVRAVVTKPKP